MTELNLIKGIIAELKVQCEVNATLLSKTQEQDARIKWLEDILYVRFGFKRDET